MFDITQPVSIILALAARIAKFSLLYDLVAAQSKRLRPTNVTTL